MATSEKMSEWQIAGVIFAIAVMLVAPIIPYWQAAKEFKLQEAARWQSMSEGEKVAEVLLIAELRDAENKKFPANPITRFIRSPFVVASTMVTDVTDTVTLRKPAALCFLTTHIRQNLIGKTDRELLRNN